MRAHLVMAAINRLSAELGEQRGSFYYATFSCKDVLEALESEVTAGNLRYIAYIVTKGYPESSLDGGSKGDGRTLNMKIRSK